jgi:predicted GNAT family acetyltransferase
MLVEHIADPEQFGPVAGAFIAARESENFLMLGLIDELAQGRREGTGDPALYVVRDEGGAICGAALWAGYGLIVTRGTPESHAALADFLETRGTRYPMLCGPAPAASAMAIALFDRTHRPHAPGPVMRALEAREILPPSRPAPGVLRPATLQDLAIAVDWNQAFSRELDMGAAANPDRVRWRIEQGRIWLWCDPEPVAMASAVGPTPTGIRIGLVYTPPDLRRRGYASACVAELTRRLLQGGRSSVFLYTEAYNKTSNHIYESIGYRFMGEWQEFDLNPSAS